MHPDKQAPFEGVQEVSRTSHDLFVQIQQAYGYLSNPTTRLIYDRFGAQGIKVHETYPDEFRALTEELRS